MFFPLSHRLCTVVAIWLVSVTMALPKVTYINFDGGCTWSVGQEEWLFFLVPAFLVYYMAPLLCIAINCGLIISHLHRCRASLVADRRNKKATALLIASTLVFAVSWLPYYALEFVNVLSPYVSSAASPTSRLDVGPFSPLPTLYSAAPSSGLSKEALTRVTLLWEVASLTAILLVCLAPCWNPPLYFLLSRPAVRQLRALLPSFFQSQLRRKPAQHWRIAPAPPPCLPARHAAQNSQSAKPDAQIDSAKIATAVLTHVPPWDPAHMCRPCNSAFPNKWFIACHVHVLRIVMAHGNKNKLSHYIIIKGHKLSFHPWSQYQIRLSIWSISDGRGKMLEIKLNENKNWKAKNKQFPVYHGSNYHL